MTYTWAPPAIDIAVTTCTQLPLPLQYVYPPSLHFNCHNTSTLMPKTVGSIGDSLLH